MQVTLNPADMNGNAILTNGNLTIQTSSVSNRIRATHGKSSGKWYWEVTFDSGSAAFFIGVANKAYPISTGSGTNYRAVYWYDGRKYPENTTYSSGVSVGTVIGVALDLDNGTLAFYKNGVNQGNSHVNLINLGEVFPLFIDGSTANSKTLTFNFGATPFSYPVPNGYQPYTTPRINKILISAGGSYFSLVRERFVNANKISSNASVFTEIVTSSTPAPGGEAWKLFDGDLSTTFPNTGVSGWVIYDFKVPTQIVQYRIGSKNTSVGSTGGSPKDWTLEGSNDGENWTVIDRQTNVENWSQGEYKVFPVYGNYSKYKLNITAKSSGATASLAFAAFDLLKRELSTVKYIPTLNEQYFINHGLNELTSEDLYSTYDKLSYITKGESLGSGNVFKVSIDTSKHFIKKVEVTDV